MILPQKRNPKLITSGFSCWANTNKFYNFIDQFLALGVLVAQVLIPNGAYKGQKLIKLVITKIPAKTNSTIPSVPEIVPL